MEMIERYSDKIVWEMLSLNKFSKHINNTSPYLNKKISKLNINMKNNFDIVWN